MSSTKTRSMDRKTDDEAQTKAESPCKHAKRTVK